MARVPLWLGSFPIPLCLQLAWFQSGWEGTVPASLSAGVTEPAGLQRTLVPGRRKGRRVLLALRPGSCGPPRKLLTHHLE